MRNNILRAKINTLDQKLGYISNLYFNILPSLSKDAYYLNLLAGIKEAENVLEITSQFLQVLIDDINIGRCEHLMNIHILKKYLSFLRVEPYDNCNKIDDEYLYGLSPRFSQYIGNDPVYENDVTGELLKILNKILMEIETKIYDITDERKWITKTQVIDYYLPDMDDDWRNLAFIDIKEYREDLRTKRLEDRCANQMSQLKAVDFFAEMSEKSNIIREEARLEGIDPKEAAFRHCFREDKDDGLTPDKEILLSYCIEYGVNPSEMWTKYFLYKGAWEVLKDQQTTIDSRAEYNEDTAVEDLKQYFFYDEDETRKFVKKAKGAKDTDVVQELNLLLKKEHPQKIISISNKKELHKILHYHHLYDAGYNNFSTQLKV